MAQTRIQVSHLPALTTGLATTDEILVSDAGVVKRMDISVWSAATETFTNKTFDADATGNNLTNIEVANLKSGVLDTDLASVSGNDDTLASAKAIKTYVDAQVDTEDTILELNDTAITGDIGAGEILKWDGSNWINNTLAEAGVTSTSPAGNAGSIQFSDGSAFAADNGQLHWDASNNRLGIGTASPAKPLHISLGAHTSGTSRVRATSMIVLEDDTTDEIGIQFLMPGTSGTPQQSIFFGDAADGTVGSIIYDHEDDAFRIQAGGTGSQMTITGGNTGYVSSKGLAVLLKRGSTQTISNNTNTSVEWDGTLYDNFSMHDPGSNNGERIVMPVDGFYLVGAIIGWQSTSNSTGVRRIILTKSGATVATNRYNPASGEDPRHECTIMEYFSANQYATVQVYQNCGTGLTIDANVSRFWAVKVA